MKIHYSTILFGVLGIGILCFGLTDSPSMVVGAIFAGAFFLIIAIFCEMLNQRNINRQKLAQNGIKGKAEILYVEQTGTYINRLPQVKFLLKITLPNRPPYQIEHKETMNYLSLGSIHTGAKLPVYVDPNDPKHILLEL